MVRFRRRFLVSRWFSEAFSEKDLRTESPVWGEWSLVVRSNMALVTASFLRHVGNNCVHGSYKRLELECPGCKIGLKISFTVIGDVFWFVWFCSLFAGGYKKVCGCHHEV